MNVRAWESLVLATLLPLAACSTKENASKPATDSASTAATQPPAPPAAPAAPNETAPAIYHARFETSAGSFVIEVHRDWAPLGADRFYNLVKNGVYDTFRFFRALTGFMAQFGVRGEPAVAALWHDRAIADDPVKQSNTRGMVSF